MSNDAHSRPSGTQEEPLYDTSVPTPTHAERARTLVTALKTGTLCTVAKEPAGYPYGSFITFALHGSDPVFFVSDMAEHTKNLRADPRASLLVAESRDGDPLANGRVTLLGEVRPVPDTDTDVAKKAYLAAHPNAAYYIDYRDFGFWKLEVSSVRYIGGYGRMSWVEAEHWNECEADPIAAHAEAIIEHMNMDHAEALAAYCRVFSKATDTTKATMTAVDRYGFEMSAETEKGPRPIRLAFTQAISTSEEAREQLVALAKRSREALDKKG